jgi:hypothetical protein
MPVTKRARRWKDGSIPVVQAACSRSSSTVKHLLVATGGPKPTRSSDSPKPETEIRPRRA